ncbi:MAG TPA: adenylate/guanylate cyclase domain-containing protein [Longimicrobiaceae bacterium]|nr:adenylate/guanylate cyclase domain-containing protein [Longimicrobiaceae bacterium]
MMVPRAAAAAGIAVAAAAAALALVSLSLPGKVAEQVEETTLDWRMRSVPPRPASESPVVLVFFDSASVREWPYLVPFPRAVLADLVETVARTGPRAIGVDVYLDRRYPLLDTLDGGEARLREALRRAGNVVLPAATEATGAGRAYLPPHPFFASVAAGVGVADTPTPYETVRDGALAVDAGGRLYPGFAAALFARATGANLDSLLADARRTGTIALRGLPPRASRPPERDRALPVPILFRGPPSRPGRDGGAFPAFAAGDLLALGDLVPPEWFRGKVVLLGSGFHPEERFRTPFYSDPGEGPGGGIAGWTYGVELHASLVENLLTGRFPRPVPAWASFAALLAGALLVAGVTFARGAAWGAGAAVALFLLNGAAAFWAFGAHAVALPMVAPALGMVLAFLGSTSYVSMVEGREKRDIRNAFSKYVSPAVVAELIRDPSRLRLAGEKRHITVLFSDLEGFTALSETHDPEELLGLLNRFFDEMTRLVIDERGTLDKYVGDSVMALFGAPALQPDHALHACRTALRMQRRLTDLNLEWVQAGWPAMRMRIGVNTGTPVVGNVGHEHINYTALGDAVNLAARLEPACKGYGVGILISHDTRVEVGAAVVARELELLAVYGRAEPEPVYELVALAGEELGPRAEVLARFAEGLAAFRARDFEMALVYFQAALAADPDDAPAALYVARCHELIAHPPPAEWSFVERHQIK